MTIARLVSIAKSISWYLGFFGLSFFLLYWPASNLYWSTAIFLFKLHKLSPSDTLALWNPGVLAMFMVFLTPLWVFAIKGFYYAAITLSILSLRPYLILLSVVAWLSVKGFIPQGHIGWKSTETGGSVLGMTEAIDWKFPVLYSALCVLVAIKYLTAESNGDRRRRG